MQSVRRAHASHLLAEGVRFTWLATVTHICSVLLQIIGRGQGSDTSFMLRPEKEEKKGAL